jgi:branched-chain amino acid transport system substrate-binding protein
VAIPSGTNINGAKEILRGVAQAQQEINQAGGVQGVPIKILIANDNNDPETAKKLAQALSKNSEILGVVGHWASDVTLAAGEVYQSEKLVAISPVSSSVKISSLGNYIFRTVPSDRFSGSALSSYMIKQLNKKKVAIFFNSQINSSQSLKDEFSQSVLNDGGEVVGEFDFAQANFNAFNDWQQAKNQGAEALMLAATSNTIDQALQVIEVNKQRLPLLAGEGGYEPKILQIGGSDAVGMVLAVPWHLSAHVNEPFVRNSLKLWNADVSWRTALAYDATKTLIAGLKQTPNPTRQSIQKALSTPGFSLQGASGKIQFFPSGDRQIVAQLVTVKPSKPSNRSGFGYNFEQIPGFE